MNYFSENNADFLVDTGLTKTIEMRDDIFRPTSMVSRITYDIMLGSAGVSTPFRYHINNRYFILVLEGSAKIKIAPPKSSKYMDCIYDYDNFEFRSKEGPPRQVKTMDIKLSTHEVLFIPPYWWYSITFDTASTKLLCYSYQTIMSTLSISPQLFMHLLQSNNIKRNNYTKLCT
jgi:hypothetical protein